MQKEVQAISHSSEVEVLKFIVNGNLYAIDVNEVREILKIEQIVSVPNFRREVAGVSMVRGHIVTVLDLQFILDQKLSVLNELKTTLLCEVDESRFALLVDEVIGIQRIEKNQIILPDSMLKFQCLTGSVNLNDTIVMLISVESVVHDVTRRFM